MLRIYNTFTRKKDLFRPLVEGKVGIYTCGPTLHDHAHLGLLRRLMAVDVLKRALRAAGYQVKHIVNLTDVDDKTIAESGRRGIPLSELTSAHAEHFFADVAALRMLPADKYPRATEHVEDMLAMTRRLVEAGVAYEMHRSVYFDISKFPHYGRLSRVDLGRIKTGITVELDYYEKDNPRDFTLVRRSDLKELRRRITWPTEWGNVRPGWHIECAAMATHYLGPRFDIHTSGQDLLFPHNENENAICSSLSGQPMARLWLHAGMLLRDGKKMSRSAGTALTMRDLVGRGYSGSQVRYFLLGTHYRRDLDVTFEALDAACRELARLNALIGNLRQVRREDGPHREIDDLVAKADADFFAALDDDLNVPRAKAVLFALLRTLNSKMGEGALSRCDAELALDFLHRADRVVAFLDFGHAAAPDRTADVEAMIAERQQARERGDFARADELRGELAALGVVVKDSRTGSRVR